jgi:RNA 3'-terminal phosphate cyclase-like protein
VKDRVKSAFLDYLPDIWIYTDFYKGDKAALSPGYSLTLKAETTTGSILTYDAAYQGETTEEFVKNCVNKFMDEIKYCGVISTNYQWFLLTLMAIS